MIWETIKMEKAKTIDDLMNVFQLYPLDENNFNFYCDSVVKAREWDIVSDMTYRFQHTNKDNLKILLTGHMGSGKTTELYRFREGVKDNYKVVVIDVEKELDKTSIDYIDLIFTMMSSVLEANRELLENTDSFAEFEKIYAYWCSERVISSDNSQSRATELGLIEEIGVQSKASLPFSKMFSLLMKVSEKGKAIFRTSSDSKVSIRLCISKSLDELVIAINRLIAGINRILMEKENKKLLLIVENLDKVDNLLLKDLFIDHRKTLLMINANIIFTYSMFMLYSNSYKAVRDDFDFTYVLGMVQLQNRKYEYLDQNIDVLVAVVNKRCENVDDLIDKETLKRMIKKSGGLLRDLFTMISNASVAAGMRKRAKISDEDADFAINLLRKDYAYSLTLKEQRNQLMELRSNPEPLTRDDTFLGMLQSEAIIEQNNGDFCIVHPLVCDILDGDNA